MASSNHASRLPGGIKLFQAFGIDVYLHWAWAIVAYYFYEQGRSSYHNPAWAMAEVLALFGIVLIHEFGHALACRSVGGKAEHIMLWPLGGVAFVQPPFRPGAMLWSIVAGPLVNVVLIPVTLVAYFAISNDASVDHLLLQVGSPNDLTNFLATLVLINFALLIFNMLPIYPLDGGKIVWSVLWFFIGPARSLTFAAYLGLLGVAAGGTYALIQGDWWLILIAAFAAWQCKRGIDEAKLLKYHEAVKRSHAPDLLSCPACRRPPPVGPYWQCECGGLFDLPSENGRCPHCGRAHSIVVCPYCMNQATLLDWRAVAEPA